MDDETVLKICAGECGAECCSGDIYVGETDADRLRGAGHDGFLSSEGGPRTMRTDDEGRCHFLDGDNRCTIYYDRPIDCQLFPFGFVLDDEVIEIVVVDCPLSTRMSDELIAEMLPDIKEKIATYTPADLAEYDSLPFTGEYTVLDTVPTSEFTNGGDDL